MKTVEIGVDILWRFRFNACDNCHDGFDRALWYDMKTEKFFQTCESKSTNYTFDNPNDILLLIFVEGNNNSQGLDEICEGCSEECTCEKGDILYDVCSVQTFERMYPIKPFNYGTKKYENIEFEEV